MQPSQTSLKRRIDETVALIRSRTRIKPRVGIILGSGLGEIARHVAIDAAIPYAELPHLPVASGVVGHAGRLLLGELDDKKVVVMEGRFHFYEGFSMEEVTYPVRVMHALGIRELIVSNACGGLNRQFVTGDLMLITDVWNMMFENPLIGPNDARLGPRFPDMSRPFSDKMVNLAREVARDKRIKLQTGTYVSVTGPNYETRAELRFLARLGGDAVGMSTVPEVIVARHAGLEDILGISVVTDMATGEFKEQVTHEAVLQAAAEVGPRFVELVREVIRRL